ncbi:MAG TPA: phosphatidylglycerophosphatase A [Thermodesulfobacteriaceae bacterium]|nr:phosphatidylglycerophosphatase A [Thermodesulfobacteriaceae bacterium]
MERSNTPPVADALNAGFKNRAVIFLATGMGLGLMPVAPGTWGSLLGLPFHWLFRNHSTGIELAAAGILILVSIWIAEKAAVLMNEKDPSRVVIDEVCGIAVALAGAPISPGLITSAFVLFRIFDMWKPFPVRQIEKKLNGGPGIVLDDVAAGIMANIAWRILYITVPESFF